MRLLCNLLFAKFKTVTFPSISRSRLLLYSVRQMSSEESNIVYIRRENDSEHFQATFNWNYNYLNIHREFNFNRKSSEKLQDFLGRVKTNVEKVVLNKTKRKKKMLSDASVSNVQDVKVNLFYEKTEVSPDIICEDVFFSNSYDPKKLMLKIIDTEFDIKVNSPLLVRLVLPSSIMAEFPVYPIVDIKFGEKHHSLFNWYRYNNTEDKWIQVCNDLVYTPPIQDIGSKLKLSCTPGNGSTFGPTVTIEANVKVEAGPGLCPYHVRHQYTKEKLPSDRFRVVSYNILADLYAETEVAKTELFPYCPPYALSVDYRKQLYLQEILGYNGDIICLQEVDVKIFENEFQDILGRNKLSGIMTRKGSTIAEGVATFYSSEKFRLLETKTSELGNEIDINPIYRKIWLKIKDNIPLKERFKERTTVLQVLILESIEQPFKKIIVGNTHLFFHPDADHIRLLQAGMILVFMEDIYKSMTRKFPTANISLIMCGDFNSTPDSGIYRLMTTKHVPTDIVDWKSKEGEEVEGLELQHSFSIDSACGTPLYTNYTVGFSGCLDYIYYENDKLNVTQVVPLPDEKDLKANVAIPSITFPSDHIALIADFEWKS
ncbi:hypothetical protein O3M35_005444 [Rhynocoris fuscipes]|uniref:2',5'-phosphodiesterase 12 n=1 Tax=Rhynocoris fuscipes TaxID=488301 RepID=A0AAW1DI91_9HEMI